MVGFWGFRPLGVLGFPEFRRVESFRFRNCCRSPKRVFRVYGLVPKIKGSHHKELLKYDAGVYIGSSCVWELPVEEGC